MCRPRGQRGDGGTEEERDRGREVLRRVMKAWQEEGEGTVLAQNRCFNASADQEAANHVLGLAGRPKAGRRTKPSQSLPQSQLPPGKDPVSQPGGRTGR